jgi:XrtN system VIT domain protein
MENTLEPVSPTDNLSLQKPEKHRQILLIGYLMLLVSFPIFLITEYTQSDGTRSEFFGLFVVHYLIALTYAGILLFNKGLGIRKSWKKENLGKTIILLHLFYISAYALNREITVFNDSTEWLSVYTIVASVFILSFSLSKSPPRWFDRIRYFVLGSITLFYVYQALFVAPLYMVGSIGLILFGIGGHIFVPLTLLVASVSIMYHHHKSKLLFNTWLIAGSLSTILVVTVFIFVWDNRIKKIQKLASQSVLYSNAQLPVWVKVSQSVPNDWITLRILKSQIVYTVPLNSFSDWDFMPSGFSWDEKKKHDPLVFIASFINSTTLSSPDRLMILQSLGDSRHNAEERLWSGDNLVTSYIVTDIEVYPQLRLAYTEKYIDVKNDAGSRGWWGNTQEAIYTFQLPEGSVVTSLSLWINGKEEKGILTSKQKARQAYKTIVGVESRDPSVVQWQEGNTVTVRVFPCTIGEERKFKIGVTTPLTETDGQLIYHNMKFKGPFSGNAQETIRVRFQGSPSPAEMPGFIKDKKGDFISENRYDPEFRISMKAVPFKIDNRFIFDGFQYSLEPYKTNYRSFQVGRVYLDINSSWSDHELDSIKKQISTKDVFVYDDEEFIKLGENNWEIANDLLNRNFSLFPFHLLEDSDHSLVITKGKSLSLHLSDIKESKFAEGISTFFRAGRKVHVYNLEGGTSTYISSLRELRGLQYTQGSVEQLHDILKNNQYPVILENEGNIVLHNARVVISKKVVEDKSINSNAPDHLARLFAYNNVLRKVGPNYFNKDFIDDDLVKEASMAYIVSPVSSLIVLETKEDYKRFDITETENSLHNAAKDSSGAVPEPHEWALIVLFLLLVVFLQFRNFKMRSAI